MEKRILFAVILFFVLGSAAVSGSDSISQTAKSIFHGIGMLTLGIIGIVSLYNIAKKRGKRKYVVHISFCSESECNLLVNKLHSML